MIERFDRPFTSRYVVLDRENVDTDQIIPARFLLTGRRAGLGRHLFHNWRFTPSGEPRTTFPLDLEANDAGVLVAGPNFGCGSSREHAVWSLLDAGFRAVVSASFGDIFRANALGNGLLPIELRPAAVARLVAQASAGTPASVTIDVASQTIALPDASVESFAIAPFRKHCLVSGLDELDYLLSLEPQRLAFEAARGTGFVGGRR